MLMVAIPGRSKLATMESVLLTSFALERICSISGRFFIIIMQHKIK
jgi:hypothetical protein